MFVVPCKVPLPRLRVAVTTVLLSVARRLPNWSSTRTIGWGAKAAPAVAVGEGWVRMVSRLAVAGVRTVFDDRTGGVGGKVGTPKAMCMVLAGVLEMLVEEATPPLSGTPVVPCQ